VLGAADLRPHRRIALHPGRHPPVHGRADFFIYQHENTLDADGVALPYSMTLAPYGLSKGGNYSLLWSTSSTTSRIRSATSPRLTIAYDRLDEPRSWTRSETLTDHLRG
jgi:hypothetical protein